MQWRNLKQRERDTTIRLYSEFLILRAEGRAEGRSAGINEGRSEEKTAIARNMLTKGYDLKTVSELTGLSTDEVLALK